MGSRQEGQLSEDNEMPVPQNLACRTGYPRERQNGYRYHSSGCVDLPGVQWEPYRFGPSANDLDTDIKWNIMGRQPCGDASKRVGCTHTSPWDFFLTCSDSFDLGINGSHCHGIACVKIGSLCALNEDDRSTTTNPQSPLEANVGPRGGYPAVVSHWHSQSAGAGGDGACPTLLHARQPESHLGSPRNLVLVPSSPQGAQGWTGLDGLAVVSRCTRKGAYTLALQRCSAATGTAWTLHGLWPAGVAHCSGPGFDLNTLPQPMRERLSQHWPSCSQGSTDAAFWEHEWNKHGQCLGTDLEKYFQIALDLLEKHSGRCEQTTGECRLCLTKDFELCGDLPTTI